MRIYKTNYLITINNQNNDAQLQMIITFFDITVE